MCLLPINPPFALWFYKVSLDLYLHAVFQLLEDNLCFNSVYIIWVLTLYETFFARSCLFSILILKSLLTDTLFYSPISRYHQLAWVLVTLLCSYMITFTYLTRVSNRSAEIKSLFLLFFFFFFKHTSDSSVLWPHLYLWHGPLPNAVSQGGK